MGIMYDQLPRVVLPLCDASADFSGDGLVGIVDLKQLVKYWLIQTGQGAFEPCFDLNNSGTIDYGDFASIGQVWLQDIAAPSVPDKLSLTFVTAALVSFGWDASGDNVGVDHYRIYRDGIEVGRRNGTVYTEALPAPDTLFAYQISAVDAAGNESVLSESVEVIYVSP